MALSVCRREKSRQCFGEGEQKFFSHSSKCFYQLLFPGPCNVQFLGCSQFAHKCNRKIEHLGGEHRGPASKVRIGICLSALKISVQLRKRKARRERFDQLELRVNGQLLCESK